MGCVYRRGNTLWIKYYRNGKPYSESSQSDKMEVAKRLLKKREGEIAQGKLPGVLFDKVKFDELAEDFLADYKINQRKSLERTEISVEHLKKEFEGFSMPHITTTRIRQYIEKRVAENASNATVNRELSALKRMLNLGAQQTPPKVDRVPHIPMLKENNVRTGFFEHGDFLALRENLPEHLRSFVTFAYKTGWRRSEITGLTWNQVDLKNGIVMLNPGETKNDDGRTVYLDTELQAILEHEWRARPKRNSILPYVFMNEKETDQIKRFDKTWRTACKNAKIGDRLFHDLRRTAVRNMIRSGVPERVAMMVSGHKTRSVFERYNIVSADDLKLAAQRQEAYLNAQHGYKMVTIEDFEAKKEASYIS